MICSTNTCNTPVVEPGSWTRTLATVGRTGIKRLGDKPHALSKSLFRPSIQAIGYSAALEPSPGNSPECALSVKPRDTHLPTAETQKRAHTLYAGVSPLPNARACFCACSVCLTEPCLNQIRKRTSWALKHQQTIFLGRTHWHTANTRHQLFFS